MALTQLGLGVASIDRRLDALEARLKSVETAQRLLIGHVADLTQDVKALAKRQLVENDHLRRALAGLGDSLADTNRLARQLLGRAPEEDMDLVHVEYAKGDA